MNCEWVRENITLYLYGELADDARHELEQHTTRCQSCAAELSEQRAFQEQMNALPVEEPSASFLAASRMRLQEALEQTSPHRAWYQRWAFDPAAWLRQVRFSPALAMAIFMVGFGGGLGAMYQTMRGKTLVTPQEPVQEAAIGGITSIEKDPATNQVKVQYDRVSPGSVQGTVNDPKVQDLLLYAAKSNDNAGVRLNSVDALSAKTDDPKVRETLTYALRYDSNPGVRLHSLEGLSAFVKEDIRVRNAVLEALLNDGNLGVRSGALHALEPVKADSSVRMALQQLAKEDPSDYIRAESKRVLASMPTVY
ncbi:MAG TPA: HEAT repeat domain-containing protein [Candidatus Eisenbacteria bacterium]|nr:HEAT repeat domain-containing protein [Candidatus Eisenbacteria bacterium]